MFAYHIIGTCVGLLLCGTYDYFSDGAWVWETYAGIALGPVILGIVLGIVHAGKAANGESEQ